MNKSRHGSLVVAPNRDYVSSVVECQSGCRDKDRQRFLDVGFLISRVLILVFCLLVRAVFLSLHQYQRLDHYPQTLRGKNIERTSNNTDITQLKRKLE